MRIDLIHELDIHASLLMLFTENARTGVLQALVNRTSALSTDAQALVEV